MRLLIVRHADPDYSIDSLTPAGWEEAKLLADRLAPIRGGGFIMYRRWGVPKDAGVPCNLKKSLPHGRNLQLAA